MVCIFWKCVQCCLSLASKHGRSLTKQQQQKATQCVLTWCFWRFPKNRWIGYVVTMTWMNENLHHLPFKYGMSITKRSLTHSQSHTLLFVRIKTNKMSLCVMSFYLRTKPRWLFPSVSGHFAKLSWPTSSNTDQAMRAVIISSFNYAKTISCSSYLTCCCEMVFGQPKNHNSKQSLCWFFFNSMS